LIKGASDPLHLVVVVQPIRQLFGFNPKTNKDPVDFPYRLGFLGSMSLNGSIELALSFSFGVALFHFMGALAAVVFSKSCKTQTFGLAMAISTGVMAYVSFGQLFLHGFRSILKHYKESPQRPAIVLSIVFALSLVGVIVRWLLGVLVGKIYTAMGVHALHGYVFPDSPPLTTAPPQVEEHPKPLMGFNAAKSRFSIILPMALHSIPIGLILFTSLVQNIVYGIILGFAMALENFLAAISTAAAVQSTSGSKRKAFAWVCIV
jgi:zinc transporter ZupT